MITENTNVKTVDMKQIQVKTQNLIVQIVELKWRKWIRMRKIKFRTWDDITNNLVNIEFLDMSKSRCEQTKKVVGYAGYPELRDDFLPYQILMQFTGLKDKNGKEIYEGDIVKPLSITGSNIVVKFKEGMFNIASMMKFNYNFEVIGNIYENPELLTQSSKEKSK